MVGSGARAVGLHCGVDRVPLPDVMLEQRRGRDLRALVVHLERAAASMSRPTARSSTRSPIVVPAGAESGDDHRPVLTEL